MKLRNYQESFVNDIRSAMAKGSHKLIAKASTGFGKSITIAFIAKLALDKGGRVNIVLPRKSLVAQLSDSFTQYEINHTVLMGQEPYYSKSRCKIISIDTYLSRLKSGKLEFIDADLLMIDEAHSQHSEKKIELFHQYPKVIGFTATPAVTKKRPLGLVYNEIVQSISMTELQDLGYLLPYRYFAASDFHIDAKTDAEGEFVAKDLDRIIDEMLTDEEGNTTLVGDVYTNWEKIAGDRSTVVFAKTQAHAMALCEEFENNGVRASYIDCNTEMEDRARLFNDIKTARTQVIVNVGIISMGVDLPILSCVVLACPVNKIPKYHQACGRASRPYLDQKDAIIIDHCGIVAKLGTVEDFDYWTLEGDHTVEDLAQKAKEEKKEPKEIVCPECHTVYKGRRDCPSCGYQFIKEGEVIPCHEAELVEIKTDVVTPADKEIFFSGLLGYAKIKGYKPGWSAWKFKEKFGHFPNKKKGVLPKQPSDDVVKFIKHMQIKTAKTNEFSKRV